MKSMAYVGMQKKSVILGKVLGILGFAVLLALSTMIKVPLFFTPVPLTLQNFVVFLAGALLGPLSGMAAVLLYIVLGSCVGTLAFFGPTGGYLVGFVAAAGLVGILRPALALRNIFVSFLVMASGAAVIYVCGSLWLIAGFGWTMKQAIALGVLPFVGGDAIKALAAATACRGRRA